MYCNVRVDDLKKECKSRGIKNYSSSNKASLIKMLEDYDNTIAASDQKTVSIDIKRMEITSIDYKVITSEEQKNIINNFRVNKIFKACA